MIVKNGKVKLGTEIEADPEVRESATFITRTGLPQPSQIFTDAPAAAGSTNGIRMEFGRWRDVQHIWGIKRSLLHLLCAEGKIKSVLIRRKSNVHGTRYYYLPSVRAYLHSLLELQNPEDGKNVGGEE